MNKIVAKLRDERMLLLLAYCFSTVNFYIVKYLNSLLLEMQSSAIITNWMPLLKVLSILTAVLTFLAFFIFIFRKAPKYKWVGYALLIMTLLSITFNVFNVNGLGGSWQSGIYFTLNLAHITINLMLAYLILTYQFCNEKLYNIVIASKLIIASLLLVLSFIEFFTVTRLGHSISSLLMTFDLLLRFAVIVVLLLSVFQKPDEILAEQN